MVMATGFPVPDIPQIKGILIPFGQMLEMADILYDVNLEEKDGNFGGVYLDGVSYILYPISRVKDERDGSWIVQWHLEKKPRGNAMQRDQAVAPDSGSGKWLRGVTLEDLSKSKAVLGYCSQVVTQLGTQSRVAQFGEYRRSLASPHDPPPEVSLTGLSANLALKGWAGVGGTASVRYPKGHRVSRMEEKEKEYTEILEEAEDLWVILFETAPGQERAWLVSGLSLILELFNFWSFKRGIKNIRYARPGTTGVPEAKEILEDGDYASHIVVPKKIPSDKGLCIGDIIKRIFNRIETRISESAGDSKGESDKGKITLGLGGIVGWDWLELAGAPPISEQRSIPGFPEPCWKPFTGLRIPVFMGQNLGQLITPDPAWALCNRWDPIPGGREHNLLVASVASIQALAQHSGWASGLQGWQYSFSERLSWQPTSNVFEGCTPRCMNNPRRCRKRPQVLVNKKKGTR